MHFDFTLRMYSRFCEVLNNLSCPIITLNKYLQMGQPRGFYIMLRHDVDRSMKSAVRMAEMEAKYGIRASYYIRMTNGVFRAAEIKKIYQLGHEIGYHYEVLAKANGDPEIAAIIFANELRKLRKIVPIHTISMHGSPLKPWNNINLWKTHDYRKYDLKGEISLSINYSKLYYFTDTGRGWDSERYNLRDRVNSKAPIRKIKATYDLIDFLKKSCEFPVIINVHPNRWSNNFIEYLVSMFTDWSANQVKWMISVSRKKG